MHFLYKNLDMTDQAIEDQIEILCVICEKICKALFSLQNTYIPDWTKN